MFWPLFHCFFALSPFAAILRFQFNSKRVSVWLLFVFVSDFVLARRDQAKLTSKSADFCRCAISVSVCVCVSRRIEEQVRPPARWAVGRRTVFGASNCNSVCCCFICFGFLSLFKYAERVNSHYGGSSNVIKVISTQTGQSTLLPYHLPLSYTVALTVQSFGH